MSEGVQLLEKYNFIFKTLANRHRVNIIYKLYEGIATFSQLMFDLRINPRSLSAHLKYFKAENIVQKNEKDYELTERGRRICRLDHFNIEKLKELGLGN